MNNSQLTWEVARNRLMVGLGIFVVYSVQERIRDVFFPEGKQWYRQYENGRACKSNGPAFPDRNFDVIYNSPHTTFKNFKK